MGRLVQTFRFNIVGIVLGLQPGAHSFFNPRAHCGIKIRRVRHRCYFHTQLLQFFSGVFGAVGEHALLFVDGAQFLDSTRVVASLDLGLGGFHSLFDSSFTLLHLVFKQLFQVAYGELAAFILQLADHSAVSLHQHRQRQFAVRHIFLSNRGAHVHNAHGHALRSVICKRA